MHVDECQMSTEVTGCTNFSEKNLISKASYFLLNDMSNPMQLHTTQYEVVAKAAMHKRF